MKFLYLIAHPNTEKSFNHKLLKLGVEYLTKNKQEVKVIDLYDEKFDPMVEDKDHDQTKKYIQEILDCDIICIQIPLYWWSVPAILKGLLDNVFPLVDEEEARKRKVFFSVTSGGIYNRSGMLDYMGHVFQGVKDCKFELIDPFFATGINFAGEGKRKTHGREFLKRLSEIVGVEPEETEGEEEDEGEDKKEEGKTKKKKKKKKIEEEEGEEEEDTEEDTEEKGEEKDETNDVEEDEEKEKKEEKDGEKAEEEKEEEEENEKPEEKEVEEEKEDEKEVE